MRRSTLLHSAASAVGLCALPARVLAEPAANGFDPQPDGWRTFEVTTEMRLVRPGRSQAWIPLPAVTSDWIRPLGNTWSTNAATARVVRDPAWGAQLLALTWDGADVAPAVTVHSRVTTRDRRVDLAKPAAAALSPSERRLYTRATRWIPTDGLVKTTADQITVGATTDLEKARRLYAWMVEHTFRDPATRGCGTGDVAAMLQSGVLGGKCADLNALYVGMARASGIPARDLYGIRVAPSRFGYKSLGANSEVITGAQHCRAEVHLADYGWVPVDPADVRKVMLEEPPGNRPLADPAVAAARETLFGAWEGNWIAYNAAHDVTLPGSSAPPLGFLMYPQAENAGIACDCLEPGAVAYRITAQPLSA